MLDVITDFWKPVKKAAPQEKPDVDKLQIGSSITFGPVPQPALSGKTLKVSAINTYQFGEERLTSFALAEGRDDMLSLIVANADGEQYLAISRRLPFAERMKVFDPFELEMVIDQQDASRLIARDIDIGWKHWIVTHYTKELSGVKGSLMRGDFRASPSGSAPPQSFDYTLLTSENNEYAIEIEKYSDGRIEVYATIYRRLSDIVELEHPQAAEGRKAPVLEVIRSEMPAEAAPANPEPATVDIPEAPEAPAEEAALIASAAEVPVHSPEQEAGAAPEAAAKPYEE
ncbi:MAG: hypothetical protein JO089_05265, partial [Alphaproteobacteria bacterium]|nr:hypothetical protein [Alphaproteobacteria bacterium]